MRAIIIGNGSVGSIDFYRDIIKQNDYIICADGGYDRAIDIGISPDILIGDFDSITYPTDIEKIQYPTKKDMTDGEIAVRYAIEKEFDEIVMIGFIGSRMDHTLSNLFFLDLINKHGKKGIIIDEKNEIYLLKDKLDIHGEKGDLISIIPVNGNACGVSTNGLEYPLLNENLSFGSSRGVSNVMNESICRITNKSGIALVFKSQD